MQINIKLVDVVFEDDGYTLDGADCVAETKVCRASKPVVCGIGCAIPRNAYYLYSRREGRLCCRCAVRLGALVKVG